MNQETFIKRMEEEHMLCVEISRKKNADYAGAEDAFLNFKACEIYGINAEKAIIVRLSDKLVRVANLLTREAQVKDESVDDTLRDLSNYALILKLLIESKRGGQFVGNVL